MGISIFFTLFSAQKWQFCLKETVHFIIDAWEQVHKNDLIRSIIFLHYEQITCLKYWGNCYQVFCRDVTEFSVNAIKSAKTKETKCLGMVPKTMNHFYVKYLLLLFNIYSFIILPEKEAWISLQQIYFSLNCISIFPFSTAFQCATLYRLLLVYILRSQTVFLHLGIRSKMFFSTRIPSERWWLEIHERPERQEISLSKQWAYFRSTYY